MKKLLINGCSFGECWSPSKHFTESIGCDTVVNISKAGTSFQRTCRSTVEWIAQNSNPAFVMIPITFAHRWELAIADKDDPIDGEWFPLQRKELLESTQHRIRNDVSKPKISQLLDLYYGSIPTIRTYWDKIFTEMILLSAFLDNKNIDYLMFDMCNQFEKKHLKGYKGFTKISLIESNKKVIDPFSFCGNRYMWQNLDDNQNVDVNIHHAPKEYEVLEKYLLNYLQGNIL